jgi:hypothetical protein
MGTFSQTTNIFTIGTAITFANNNDAWTIDPGVVLSRANGTANGPTITSDNKTGSLLINDGYVFNGGTGDFSDGAPYGVTMFDASSRIVNHAGAVISADGYAVFTRGRVENAGIIVGGFGAVEGAGLDLSNTGELRSASVSVLTGALATILNAGLIEGGRWAIKVDRPGSGETTAITNARAGTIQGGNVPSLFDPAAAIFSSNDNAVALNNKGLVDGKVLFQSLLAGDTVVNKGTITGETRLGPGEDAFVFAGGRQGSVFGEGGADSFNFQGKLAPKKNAATIGDFTPGEDTIGLSKKLFKGIGKDGPLKDKFFATSFSDEDAHIVYKKGSGKLFAIDDGTDHVLFATLSTNLDLSANDFLVIS